MKNEKDIFIFKPISEKTNYFCQRAMNKSEHNRIFQVDGEIFQ